MEDHNRNTNRLPFVVAALEQKNQILQATVMMLRRENERLRRKLGDKERGTVWDSRN